MNRADSADRTDELTRLLRLTIEPVPFDNVDWVGLLARIEQKVELGAPASAHDVEDPNARR